MKHRHRLLPHCWTALFLSMAFACAQAQAPREPYLPREGQAGKDVVWIPSPEEMVVKMMDMAKITPRDFVIDLGSGDGRNVIAAAKRGARALGVEFNPDLVELSRRNAAQAGVASKATFVEGDMFTADISKATAMVLFLITDNLRRLTPRFLDLRPGTRIVSNTFEIPGWSADQTLHQGGDCVTWCTAYLYIVPAKVNGVWRLAQGELTLRQEFQKVEGTLVQGDKSLPIANGKLNGNQLRFVVDGVTYSARVGAEAMKGTYSGKARGSWSASRERP